MDHSLLLACQRNEVRNFSLSPSPRVVLFWEVDKPLSFLLLRKHIPSSTRVVSEWKTMPLLRKSCLKAWIGCRSHSWPVHALDNYVLKKQFKLSSRIRKAENSFKKRKEKKQRERKKGVFLYRQLNWPIFTISEIEFQSCYFLEHAKISQRSEI